MSSLGQKATGGWIIALVLYAFLLILYLAAVVLESQSTGQSPLLPATIKLLPLLAFMPGLIRRNIRAYVWLCFVLCLYFIDAVSDAALEILPVLNTVIAVLLGLLFSVLTISTRWQARFEKEEAAADGENA
ncbi:DUF2069 domain-containing protein [Hahella sp. SMD15-11]|uniref:DUF2069 domain-containing protein n=1 Tax=Thermohahella caldifontis TaxID=3142973 RepID=A0AB39UX87_9GAMM